LLITCTTRLCKRYPLLYLPLSHWVY